MHPADLVATIPTANIIKYIILGLPWVEIINAHTTGHINRKNPIGLSTLINCKYNLNFLIIL